MLLDSVNGVNNINFGKKIKINARIKPKETPKSAEDGAKQLATEAECMANMSKAAIKKSDNLPKVYTGIDEDEDCDYEEDVIIANINEYAKKYGFVPCDMKYGEDHIIFENGGEGITSDGRMVRFQLETAFLNYGEEEDNNVNTFRSKYEVEEVAKAEKAEEYDVYDEYDEYEDDEDDEEYEFV